MKITINIDLDSEQVARAVGFANELFIPVVEKKGVQGNPKVLTQQQRIKRAFKVLIGSVTQEGSRLDGIASLIALSSLERDSE